MPTSTSRTSANSPARKARSTTAARASTERSGAGGGKGADKPKSARAATAHRSGGAVDPIKLLTDDHKEVQALFRAYQKLVDDEGEDDLREQLAQEICAKLTVHATIEEEIFYPAARDAVADEEGDDLLDEAEVEHAGAKDLIAQIVEGSASDALYDAKVKVLGEYIAHHVKEEETALFPKVRKADIDLEALGDELSVRKAELLVELEEAAAP